MRRNKLSPCIWKPWSEIRIRIDSLSHKPKPIKAVIKTIQHKFANPISFRHKKHTHKYINRSVQFLTWKRKNYFPSYSSYFFCGRDQALVEICYCFRRIRKSLSHRAVSFCFCFFVHRISRNCFLCLYFLKFLRFFFFFNFFFLVICDFGGGLVRRWRGYETTFMVALRNSSGRLVLRVETRKFLSLYAFCVFCGRIVWFIKFCLVCLKMFRMLYLVVVLYAWWICMMEFAEIIWGFIFFIFL